MARAWARRACRFDRVYQITAFPSRRRRWGPGPLVGPSTLNVSGRAWALARSAARGGRDSADSESKRMGRGGASPGRDSPRTRRMTVTIRARWLCLLPLRRGRASGPGLRQASPGPPKRPALGLGSELHWHATQFRPTTWRQPARTQSHQFCRQGLLLGTVTDSRQTVIAARVGSAGHASHCGS